VTEEKEQLAEESMMQKMPVAPPEPQQEGSEARRVQEPAGGDAAEAEAHPS
jgi:hypothetical protein